MSSSSPARRRPNDAYSSGREVDVINAILLTFRGGTRRIGSQAQLDLSTFVRPDRSTEFLVRPIREFAHELIDFLRVELERRQIPCHDHGRPAGLDLTGHRLGPGCPSR
jgi:hypothetical protein